MRVQSFTTRRYVTKISLSTFLITLAWSNASVASTAQHETIAGDVHGIVTRVRYPVDRAPVLLLPDGSKEIVLSLLHTQRPMTYGEYLWNEAGVPRGNVWVRIDLSRQLLSVFRGGQEIGSAVILYGTDGKPTPKGVFSVLERQRNHISTLYDASMPFMLRLTNDGVAIHASNIRGGSATHGCIGVPIEFAQDLYSAVPPHGKVAIIG
jgi:hypothetical protein